MQTTEFWLRWLKKYKTLNCLWDKTIKTTANERLLAWDELMKMAKNADETLDTAAVLTHLKKLIANYKLQIGRVKAAEANGLIYQPKDFFYDILKNMHDKNLKKLPIDHENYTQNTEQDTSKATEKQKWRTFLKRYVLSKCLWINPTNRKIYSQKERQKAYIKLLRHFRKLVPNADLAMLRKRIKHFRIVFMRERKREQNEKKSGRSYKSTLFYYDILKKIYENENEKIEFSSDDLSSSEDDEEDVDHELSQSQHSTNFDSMFASRYKSDRKNWRKLLKRYVLFKCLWDSKNPAQYSSEERGAAWTELLRIFNKIDPNGDLRILKSRIQNCRGACLRESRRMQELKKRGRKPVTSLFYYDIIQTIYQKGIEPIKFSEDEESSDEEKKHATASLQEEVVAPLEAELKEKGFIFAPLKWLPKHFQQEIWLEVIKTFVAYECLWNKQHGDYYNANMRVTAWQNLHEIAQKIDKTITVDAVKKRIKHSRAIYKHQLKIAQEAQSKGRSHEIKLYYFNALNPLYQKGFPVLDYDEKGVSFANNKVLDNKSALNPKTNTYYPDDDDDYDYHDDNAGAISQNYSATDDDETAMETITKLEFFEENSNFNFEAANIDYVESKDLSPVNASAFETTNMEQHIIHESDPITSDVELLNFSNSNVKTIESTCKKSNECENKSIKNPREKCENKVFQISKPKAAVDSSLKFSTFEAKIIQHLESMTEDQYLYSEKFINDVCIFGRYKQLTMNSRIVLGNIH